MSESMQTMARDINFLRSLALEESFRQAVGKRVLIMMEEFPFLIIGRIEKVVGDYVFVFTETTHVDPLEDRVARIHLDRIEVFYIEEQGRPIPRIKNEGDCDCHKRRGDGEC